MGASPSRNSPEPTINNLDRRGVAWAHARSGGQNRSLRESGQAVAAAVRRCWKHSRQKTGLPWVGLNGTVVSLPHCEQTVRVSTFW